MDHLIHIRWQGPVTHQELPSLRNVATDHGLYQIYAHHPLSGHGALVYIGQAVDQTFAVRIGQEGWPGGLEPDPDNVRYYVGRLIYGADVAEADWRKDVNLAERLLIHAHGVPYNSTNGMSVAREAETSLVRVLNLGASRSLFREVSGYLDGPKVKLLQSFTPFSKKVASA